MSSEPEVAGRDLEAAAYSTSLGSAHVGDSRRLLARLSDGAVDLVMTSPPFALRREKAYGNEDESQYVDWILKFAQLVFEKLKPTGSFVLDLGGAYKKGIPSRSLYNFKVLLALCETVGFHLAEDFYWYNPARLPSPIEWVNKRKIRTKDAVNTVWWLSKTAWPKANVGRVLVPYGHRMKKLLADPERFYRPKQRPSGHDIGRAFANDNGGAIPPNLLQFANTESNGAYLSGCKVVGDRGHPARFPAKLPEFFIRFLTDPDDLVVDIFAGSNTTGQVAEAEGRRWLAFEEQRSYVAASAFRFLPASASPTMMRDIYEKVMRGEAVALDGTRFQQSLFT